jgi:hypothetical protein
LMGSFALVVGPPRYCDDVKEKVTMGGGGGGGPSLTHIYI